MTRATPMPVHCGEPARTGPPLDTPAHKFSNSVDITAAVALVLSLGVVFLLDRAPLAAPPPPPPAPVVAKLPPKVPKLAVIRPPREYDDMGSLLDRLGSGYKYSSLPLEDLEKPDCLAGFEIVFITCGTVPDSWVAEVTGAGARDTQNVTWRRDVRDAVVANLRGFVANGGTLYGSDWAINIIGSAFSNRVDHKLIGAPNHGAAQDIEADVVEDGLRRSVGDRLPLHFDMPEWRPAAFGGRDVTTYLRGSYRTIADESVKNAPLLVRFKHEKGSVIFTSFHNETVNSAAEQRLLQYLVFSAITENLVTGSFETVLTSAVSLESTSLLSSVPGKSTERVTYRLTNPGRLKVALLFNTGAHLRLVLKSPAGRDIPKEGPSTFELEVADAEPGEWTFTVSAIDVPYPHFPFRLVVFRG